MQIDPTISFFRNEFEVEEESDFSRLSRVPDTSVRRFLHYFRGLPRQEAETLKSAIAKQASYGFARNREQIELTNPESVVLERKARAVAQMGEYQFTSLKLLKM